MKRSKNSLALVLFCFVMFSMAIVLVVYGIASAKKMINDQAEAVEHMLAISTELFDAPTGVPNSAGVQTELDDLAVWLEGLNEKGARLSTQLAAASSLKEAEIWENNIQKTLVPSDWLANVQRSRESFSTHLEAGEKYTNNKAVNAIVHMALTQALRDNKQPADQLNNDMLIEIAALQGMSLFVVTSDGEFTVSRRSLSQRRNAMWQKYHAQLVNEMRQQKEGWIYLPPKAPWQLDQSQYALRFATIKRDGSIVAVETYFESEFQLFRRVFTGNVITIFFVIIIAAYCVVQLMAYLMVKRIDTLLTEFTGKSYLDNTAKNTDPKLKIKTQCHTIKKIPAGNDQYTHKEAETRAIHDKLEALKSALSNDEERPTKGLAGNAADEIIRGKLRDSEESYVNEAGAQRVVHTYNQKMQTEARKDIFCDDVTINVKGIRSSALKKIIGDIRGEKRSSE